MNGYKAGICGTKSIGIAGSREGVGVTHLAIMLANYLTSVERFKTALVEMNGSGAFRTIQKHNRKYSVESKKSSLEYFEREKVTYFPHPSERTLAGIFGSDYEYIIMDFGCEWKQQKLEWVRCNKNVLVGSCCEWQQDSFSEMLEEVSMWVKIEECTCLSLFGAKQVKKELEKGFRMKLEQIPFEVNPFLLHQEHFPFLHHLVTEN